MVNNNRSDKNKNGSTPNVPASPPTPSPHPAPADLSNLTASEFFDLLTQLPINHTIRVEKLNTGALVVMEERTGYASREEYIAQEMPDLLPLQGQAITVAEASEKYRTSNPTIYRWISSGYITVLSKPDEYPKIIHEIDVAYCARVKANRQAAGTRSGAPLLDENGLPYRFKTGMAAYRRDLRRKKKGE